MNKRVKLTILSILIVFNLFIVPTVNAEDPPESVSELATFAVTGVGMQVPRTPLEITVDIINIILTFLGLVFLIMVIVSGIQWMTSGGNEEKITKARQRLINSAIGVGIVLGAYIIANGIMTIINKGVDTNNWWW